MRNPSLEAPIHQSFPFRLLCTVNVIAVPYSLGTSRLAVTPETCGIFGCRCESQNSGSTSTLAVAFTRV
jgi:hypothetical protein